MKVTSGKYQKISWQIKSAFILPEFLLLYISVHSFLTFLVLMPPDSKEIHPHI